MEDTRPSQSERTAAQRGEGPAQRDADFRDRYRLVLYDRATAKRPTPFLSTPADFRRNPMVGWPTSEGVVSICNHCMAPNYPLSR